jgi:hypothetical protein
MRLIGLLQKYARADGEPQVNQFVINLLNALTLSVGQGVNCQCSKRHATEQITIRGPLAVHALAYAECQSVEKVDHNRICRRIPCGSQEKRYFCYCGGKGRNPGPRAISDPSTYAVNWTSPKDTLPNRLPLGDHWQFTPWPTLSVKLNRLLPLQVCQRNCLLQPRGSGSSTPERMENRR